MATLTAKFPNADDARAAVDRLIAQSLAPSRFRMERTRGLSTPVHLVVEPSVVGGAVLGSSVGFGLAAVGLLASLALGVWLPFGFASPWMDAACALFIGGALGFVVGGFGGLNTWSVRPSRELSVAPDDALTVYYHGPEQHVYQAASVMREHGATNLVTKLG